MKRLFANAADSGGNAQVRRTRIVRILMIGTALVLAVFCITRCEFDGGLLDGNSAASRENAEQVRAAAQVAADRDYFAEHQSDVHTDMVAFAASLCSATESFQGAVPESNSEPMTIAAAFDGVRADLAVLGGAARDARDTVAALALPATDRVLTPGTDASTWARLRDRVSGAFGDVANSVASVESQLNAAELSDVDAATAVLRGAGDTVGSRLSSLAQTVNDVLARLPIPNQETLAALQAAEVCGPSAA
ncbi:hypothetical protein [Nocardia rhizosphaerae]|uniref:Uncharacterized protein n=1 Tax=Nocardia rhizosphaerae TaxID=1691571 RepID=A0ABV8L4L9_9NOCA